MKTIKSTDKTIVIQKISLDEIQENQGSKLILTTSKEPDISFGKVFHSQNAGYTKDSIIFYQSKSGSSMRFEGKEYIVLFLEQILGTISE